MGLEFVYFEPRTRIGPCRIWGRNSKLLGYRDSDASPQAELNDIKIIVFRQL